MDSYVISRDGRSFYSVAVKFADGRTAIARGFETEEEAEEWIAQKQRERKSAQR